MGRQEMLLLDVGGTPMLARLIVFVTPGVCAIAISADGDLGRFSVRGMPDLLDGSLEDEGPFAGVHARLDWAMTLDAEMPQSVSGDKASRLLPGLVPRSTYIPSSALTRPSVAAAMPVVMAGTGPRNNCPGTAMTVKAERARFQPS